MRWQAVRCYLQQCNLYLESFHAHCNVSLFVVQALPSYVFGMLAVEACNMHWPMCTVYCELYTVYYGLYTVHCTVYTVHCILYTVWLILDSHVTLMRGYNDVSADNQDFCFILISVNYSFDNLDMHVLLPKHIIETNEYCFSLLENGYTLDQQHSFSSSSHCLESNCQMYSGFADRRNSPTITAAVQSVQFRNTAKIQEIQKYSQDTSYQVQCSLYFLTT